MSSPRSLRPKRAVKGKYREMLGINVGSEQIASGDDAVVAELSEEKKDQRQVRLPVMSSPSNHEFVEPDGPLEHIDRVLAQNEVVVGTTLAEAAISPKKRKKELKQRTKAAKVPKDDGDPLNEQGWAVNLTLEAVRGMMHRPLTEEEETKVEGYLKERKPENVLSLLLASQAENRVWKCVDCQELILGSGESYVAHYATMHPEFETPSFSCELCPMHLTGSVEEYQTHLHSHLENVNNLTSDSSEGSESTSGGPFICDICGKTLKHQKSLYSHRRTHTDAKAVCHICGATLKSSRYLHHHLLLHKDAEKPHKCEKCSKSFLSSSALKVHIYYNHEEHPGRFQCSICGKNFKAKQGLQFHMDSHSSELRYECTYCQKRFRGFKTCRVHEMRHREADEPCKFSCAVCGKMFKTRQTLKNHEDVHASFNRYQCSLCEKRFKLRKSCLAHIRVHHSEQERTGGGKESAQAGQPSDEMAVESILLASGDISTEEGEQYVVTLEEDESLAGGRIVAIIPEAQSDEDIQTVVIEC